MTFLVAEIGVNWDGNFEILKEMISRSYEVGCDAVKFQAYSKEQVRTHPEFERLMKSTVTKDNVQKINELCNKIGIEWFCTPMYPEAVEIIKPYVKKIKLRETDGNDLASDKISELSQKVLESNLDIIASSQNNPKKCKNFNNSKIKWLYCVPKYPCSLDDLNFKELKDFNGYSNHCQELIVPIVAVILGAEIIEIHVTLDKTKNFVDNNVSLDFNEVRLLVKMIHHIEKIEY